MRKWLMFSALFLAIGCSSSDSTSSNQDNKDVSLIISEIMYNLNGESDCQFIEIKNTGKSNIDLDGFKIDGGVKYSFSGEGNVLAPQGFIVLTNNKETFKGLYSGLEAFGEFEGTLSRKDDDVIILSPSGDEVTEVSYEDSEPWPILADGHYRSLVPVDPNTTKKQNSYEQWRASSVDGGSPMAEDPVQETSSVVVNEVFGGEEGFIEIYNPSEVEASVGGWYLSNDKDELDMFVIEGETKIAPNGYLVLEKENLPFKLLNSEQNIILSAVVDGKLTGYSSVLSTYFVEESNSFGLYKSENNFTPTTLSQPTKGAENGAYKLGEIIISEIMYHPADENYEFLVVTNISDSSVQLADENSAWKVSGVSFSFEAQTIIEANEKIVLFNGDSTEVDAFRSSVELAPEVKVFAYEGKLSNSGEKIEVLKPAEVVLDSEGNQDIIYSLSDIVEYSDNEPWQESADGDGYSLVRKDLKLFGNCHTSWGASGTANGKPNL